MGGESYYPRHASMPVSELADALERDRLAAMRRAECAAGWHDWIPRMVRNGEQRYCNRCGVPKR